MENLPDSLLLHILSLFDDSADVARCRVAWKAFNNVFPGLRSVNLRCSLEWYNSLTRHGVSNKPFSVVLMDLISKLETVESVCLVFDNRIGSYGYVRVTDYDLCLTYADIAQWLPKVSGTLKSLLISYIPNRSSNLSDFSNLSALISEYCHNLVNLKLTYILLSTKNIKPMPMLTSLTLENTILGDQHLEKLHDYFPNLQVLNLLDVSGLKHPKIHFLNLKTCVWDVARSKYTYTFLHTFTLITPNLITLKIESGMFRTLDVEAPMLSYFRLNAYVQANILINRKFENLRTLWLSSSQIRSLLSDFPVTNTVENLTLYLGFGRARQDHIDSKFTLSDVFKVFPNMSYLLIKSRFWSKLEACLNPKGWEILDWESLDESKELKTICAYVKTVDPALTFSLVSCVLYQCVGLSQVSLLIHRDVDNTVSEIFKSKCMSQWPGLKWRWGIWGKGIGDAWYPII